MLYRYSAALGALAVVCCSAGSAHAQPVDEVVVTANRTPQKLAEVPVSIEVVTAKQLETTPSLNFIDVLKKNSGVDVIQYPNGLAGVGLRGFRPDFEFSINPRTLTLVDGRPSGSTSFTTISPESIARIEVLKGPASALYGASAEGGVVNIITRRSSGPVHGLVQAGYGSFDTVRADAQVGGTIRGPADFDLGLGYVNQQSNFTTGDGVERPNSDFSRISGKARVGADLPPNLRVDATVDFANLINSQAGPVSFSPQTPSDTRLRRLGGDLRLVWTPANHRVQLVGYASQEGYTNININGVTGAAYRMSRTDSRFHGVQAQDTWSFGRPFSLTYGFDWQRVEFRPATYLITGAQTSPFSPNEYRDSKAVFAEGILKLLDEKLIITAGGRYDHIEAATLRTPYKTNFAGSENAFDVFSPRGGVVYRFTNALRIHGSASTAFAPPQGLQTTGVTTEIAGRQTRITTGNPDLQPESNTSWDVGLGYADPRLYADLTYFNADTTDRIVSRIVSETPTLRQSTYINADIAEVRGTEGVVGYDAGTLWGWSPDVFTVRTSVTRFFTARERLVGVFMPIRNVARWKADVSATLREPSGRLSATATLRYQGRRYDSDNSQGRIFTAGKGGYYLYPEFVTIDLSARWQVTKTDAIKLEVLNLLDENYYEKSDYTMPGTAAYVRYVRSF